MSSLLDMPCEIMIMILKQLDSINDLAAARPTCRNINTAYSEVRGLQEAIILRKIPPKLLDDAIMTAVARDKLRVHLADEVAVSRPHTPAAPLTRLPTRVLADMDRTYDTIHHMAMEYFDRVYKPACITWTTPWYPPTADKCLRMWTDKDYHLGFYRQFHKAELRYAIWPSLPAAARQRWSATDGRIVLIEIRPDSFHLQFTFCMRQDAPELWLPLLIVRPHTGPHMAMYMPPRYEASPISWRALYTRPDGSAVRWNVKYQSI
ncbi:hypothetical protein GE09DRAFT_1277250 [Coniochaeta sp. 2T2.1]|nr:hypothetical protein GE09DRAFT_1277250 [Coniochaeta sp. 2T2.1]